MHNLSIKKQSEALQNKTISSIELTQIYLERIENHKNLNAWISYDSTIALENAKAADKILHQKKANTLTGIPMAHKDIFCTTQYKTTCGSKMLANYTSPYSATIVECLNNQGAVLLGKTNLDEFAMGSSNQNSYFGKVHNPWNQDFTPGGSSGGSAAVVAARLASYATGSDTGGSIRQPAAFCGISGLKPTYGLISRFGMVAYASSLDTPGPMAKSAEDLAIILNAIAGYDAQDSTSLQNKTSNYIEEITKPIPTLKIGLPKSFFDEKVSSEVKNTVLNAAKILEADGASLTEIDFELYNTWIACYYILACAEASSNLARFDGIRYGHKAENANNFFEYITCTRDEGFGIEVKRRILAGTYVLSAGFCDEYYIKAQKIRRLIQNEFNNIFKNIDCILGPTAPSTAFKLGEKLACPTEAYFHDSFTVAANLCGIPALSIPVGFSSENLPIGMQLIGPHFSEALLLSLAHNFQTKTNWHEVHA